MSKRIGVVVGGGDCPGLNAVIRSVAKAAAQRGWETIGILGGYAGLLPPGNFRVLDYHAIHGLLARGGTILGTANRGQFTAKVGHGESRSLPTELLENVKRGMAELGVAALVTIGGDGSLSIAQQFHEFGIPLVGVPKTIDNDLQGTLWTFGFDSAVACATDALDRLQTTAESHRRVMVLEVMGRYAGWIALFAGIAGGADVILIPEIPFNYDAICKKIEAREKMGKDFTIVAVAEAHGKKEETLLRRQMRPKTAKPGLAALAQLWQMRSKLAPERRRVRAFWDTCNEAGAQPASTARYAQSSVHMRLNSSLVKITAKWWPFSALTWGRFRSAKPLANSKLFNRTAAWPAPLGAWNLPGRLSTHRKPNTGVALILWPARWSREWIGFLIFSEPVQRPMRLPSFRLSASRE